MEYQTQQRIFLITCWYGVVFVLGAVTLLAVQFYPWYLLEVFRKTSFPNDLLFESPVSVNVVARNSTLQNIASNFFLSKSIPVLTSGVELKLREDETSGLNVTEERSLTIGTKHLSENELARELYVAWKYLTLTRSPNIEKISILFVKRCSGVDPVPPETADSVFEAVERQLGSLLGFLDVPMHGRLACSDDSLFDQSRLTDFLKLFVSDNVVTKLKLSVFLGNCGENEFAKVSHFGLVVCSNGRDPSQISRTLESFIVRSLSGNHPDPNFFMRRRLLGQRSQIEEMFGVAEALQVRDNYSPLRDKINVLHTAAGDLARIRQVLGEIIVEMERVLSSEENIPNLFLGPEALVGIFAPWTLPLAVSWILSVKRQMKSSA